MAAIAGRRYTRLRIVVEQRTIIIKWIRILGTDYGYLLDKDCPTADLSNIGHTSGPAYSIGELLNTPQLSAIDISCHGTVYCIMRLSLREYDA